MIVTLIGDKKLYKLVLPQTDAGDYWITNDEGKKIANIIIRDGACYFKNSKESMILSGREVMEQTELFLENKYNCNEEETSLLEYSFFNVAIRCFSTYFLLYCAPSFENFSKYQMLNQNEIFIGSDPKCTICYDNAFLSPIHAKITYQNGSYYVSNIDTSYGTFVNDIKIKEKSVKLNNGDIVFLMGLRITLVGHNLFMNNPMGRMKYSKFVLEMLKTEPPQEILDDDDEEIKIYSENDYYYRSPRIANEIEEEKVKVDPPSEKEKDDSRPMLLTIGSTLSMSMISLISGISVINNISSGQTTIDKAWPQLATVFAMVIATFLIPIFSRKYDKKKKVETEQKRQLRYQEYIEKKIRSINDIMQKQKNILYDNYLSVEDCKDIVLNKNSRLFERKIDDKDFLTVRLGIGDVKPDIDISFPEENFRMEDDDLLNMARNAVASSKIKYEAPIVTSLLEKRVSSLVIKNNDAEVKRKFLQNIIIQLATLHSYEELKIVFLAKPSRNAWNEIKVLPHLWNNKKEIRFFADDYNDMKEISKYLDEVLNNRLENANNSTDYKAFKPYYLIITDDYVTTRNLRFINNVAKLKQNVGFSLLCVSDNMVELPDTNESFIVINEGVGKLFDSGMAQATMQTFEPMLPKENYIDKICKKLSDLPIKYTAEEGKASLVDSLSFLELYDTGNVEQLNIWDRWCSHDSSVSLDAPVGVDETGMIVSLDIHEKYHGPHGLIAGSTGSGKSEFIITYILSLAINYHPYDVSFVLIDYKGGGLAGAFKKGDIVLPHLVGTITNIDESGLQRSMAAIRSELKRRQIKFNDAREKTDGGTIDIYKYQKLYHDGIIKEPIPHLLIISDEFAELKQQQPEFMDELISIARIGRSLGVHLVLATQKPAGVVNDQIRSNSKFAVCLKVQDRADSMDVISRPDGAYLLKAGQFYLKVGANEYFVLGQAAWAGALYYPSNITKKKIDTSLDFISNTGRVIKQVDNKQANSSKNRGDQLTNIVKALDGLAKKHKIKSRSLWIDEIPADIYLDDIRKKYKVKVERNEITPVIGEYDNPDKQRQAPLMLDLTSGDNYIIYGNSHSGKETLLGTMVFDIISTHDTSEVNLYLFDFGTESLKIFRNAPQVADIVLINDKEKIERFFEKIQREIRNRIDILSDMGGNYQQYVSSGMGEMPLITVVMNSYEVFSEVYQNKYDDTILSLIRDGSKVGIVFVVTVNAPNDIRFRLAQNFKQKIALQLNSADDYYTIWTEARRKKPSNIFGRGLINLGDIYEFQTAKIIDQAYYNEAVRFKIEKLKQTGMEKAEPIPVLPNVVSYGFVTGESIEISKLPLGISKESLSIYSYDFTKQLINVISGKSIDTVSKYMANLIPLIKEAKDAYTIVFDADNLLDSDYDDIDLQMQNLKLIIENKVYKDKRKVVIILNLSKFLAKVDKEFDKMVEYAEKEGDLNIIICDTVNKVKNHEFDAWFKNGFIKDNGIWVGPGLADQYLFTSDISFAKAKEKFNSTFGYGIKQGEATLIKLIGMEEDEEDG